MRGLVLACVGAVLLVVACSGSHDPPAGGRDGAVGIDARSRDAGTRDGSGQPDAAAVDAGRADAGAPPETCPAPRVACAEAPPVCPAGMVAEAPPCPGGYCPGRCWTGACVPCGTECGGDGDCALVGRHGCCGVAGDCAGGCFFAVPRNVAEADPCYFPGMCPVPAPPAACATMCVEDARCLDCPHCGPNLARCEVGRCVSAWTRCEPTCGCD